MDRAPPLAGLRVLDVTHVIAGAYCSYLLCLLGADVLRVEPPEGDPLRSRGGSDPGLAASGLSTAFLAQAAGKRAVALDLRTERGAGTLRDLARDADILVENYRPGALNALGLSPAALRAANPRLITVSVTGYGGMPGEVPGGWRAYDHVIQASSGLMSLTGTEETGPLRCGPQVVDYAAGLCAAFAAMAALQRRAQDGLGGEASVSMLEAALALSSAFATDTATTGAVPRLRGNEAGSSSPLSAVYRTSDGLLAIAASEEHQAARLFAALDADLGADPRFATAAGRAAHRAALQEAVSSALSRGPAGVWELRLNAAGVPAARVRGLDEAIALQAATGRSFVLPVELPGLGVARVTGLPFALDGHQPAAASVPATPTGSGDAAWKHRVESST